MSNDYTLEDLVADAQGGGNDSGGDESNGEWVNRLFERLDEKGVIDAYLTQMMGQGGDGAPTAPTAPDTPAMSDGGTGGQGQGQGQPDAELTAAEVRKLALKLYDFKGDMTLSEMIRFLEENEEKADMIIQNYL